MTPEEMLAAYESVEDRGDTRETYQRAPFSYPGNKTESLKQILPRLPYLDTFVDVFGGSGVVTLNRSSCKLDVYNDRHSGVTAFFRVVRQPKLMQQLAERIALSLHGREEFMWSRDTWQKVIDDDVEMAARWYVSVQSSFAGRGAYFGRVTQGLGTMWRKIQENLTLFNDIGHRFLTIQIENADWRTLFKDYDSLVTVFYLDPPYIGHNIYQHGMTRNDHAEMCEKIFQCKGFFALSGYENDIYPKFPWDSVYSWEVSDMMTTMATKTETSVVCGMEMSRKNKQVEYLYIKESG